MASGDTIARGKAQQENQRVLRYKIPILFHQ